MKKKLQPALRRTTKRHKADNNNYPARKTLKKLRFRRVNSMFRFRAGPHGDWTPWCKRDLGHVGTLFLSIKKLSADTADGDSKIVAYEMKKFGYFEHTGCETAVMLREHFGYKKLR